MNKEETLRNSEMFCRLFKTKDERNETMESNYNWLKKPENSTSAVCGYSGHVITYKPKYKEEAYYIVHYVTMDEYSNWCKGKRYYPCRGFNLGGKPMLYCTEDPLTTMATAIRFEGGLPMMSLDKVWPSEVVESLISDGFVLSEPVISKPVNHRDDFNEIVSYYRMFGMQADEIYSILSKPLRIKELWQLKEIEKVIVNGDTTIVFFKHCIGQPEWMKDKVVLKKGENEEVDYDLEELLMLAFIKHHLDNAEYNFVMKYVGKPGQSTKDVFSAIIKEYFAEETAECVKRDINYILYQLPRKNKILIVKGDEKNGKG